ncbi:MAG: hypothetical protein AAF203_02770, partial [Pseudomonadota bacterium]
DGREKEEKMSQTIYIGIEDKEGEFIHFKKHPLMSGETDLTIEVESEPFKVGLDPLNMLVDKNPDDNQIKVQLEKAG